MSTASMRENTGKGATLVWEALAAAAMFAGAGGLSIGLERAGIHVAIANEIMPDFAATLAANHPDTDVVTEAIYILEAA